MDFYALQSSRWLIEMSKSHLISASILAADFSRLGEQIQAAEMAGVDWIHVDVMDGHFVPNLTMGPFIVEACRKVTQLPLDVHLMVESPEIFLAPFANAGASILSIHVENHPHLEQTVHAIHDLGCKAGVVLKPATPADLVYPVLPLVDLILVLSVNPGYSGQTFIPDVIPKLTTIKNEAGKIDRTIWFEVDGGINVDTIALARDAGANVFVSATAIFKHPKGITAAVQQLRTFLPD
jgi:ribulose-phosphate 3-epimerase